MKRKVRGQERGGPSQRQLRAAELVRHALVDIVAREELRDPDLTGASITIGEVRAGGIAQAIESALTHVSHCEAIVVDCDIDVIDRGQFPGAPGARPGGMAAHDFFTAVRMLAAEPKVRLIDLTEWDPPLDSTDLSALVAARWVAECLAGFEVR